MKKVMCTLMAVILLAVLVPVCSSADAVKAALCMTGPANDGGWCQLAYTGLLKAQEQYNIEISYTENVQVTEMEAVFYDYAAQGYDLIFGLGYQFGDPALTVAERFPDAHFVIFEGSVSAENVQSCQIANQESRYLMGYLSALLSKTGIIGFVGGVEQPSIVKTAEAFKLGAKAANPEIKVLITYTGSFTDVAGGKEAALAMADQGADIIGHGANTCGTGVIKACEERGLMAMGAAADQNEIAPKTVVCSDMYTYGDVLNVVVEKTIAGEFEGTIASYGIADGVVHLAPYHYFEDIIPEDVKKAVEDKKQEIIDGTLVVPSIEIPTED